MYHIYLGNLKCDKVYSYESMRIRVAYYRKIFGDIVKVQVIK